MIGTYEVFRKGETVGRCSVTREGLYYCFSCSCRMLEGDIHRLWLECGKKTIDLGVLAPMHGGMGLRKKLPVKQIAEAQPKFFADVRQPKREKFIPIYPDEPFKYLSRIKNSYYAERDGKIGVAIKE